jgi:hypothetical protein
METDLLSLELDSSWKYFEEISNIQVLPAKYRRYFYYEPNIEFALGLGDFAIIN